MARRNVTIMVRWVGIAGAILFAASLPAQVPVLDEIDPPAAAPGAPARLTLWGRNLNNVSALRFDCPGIRATPMEVPPEPAADGAAKSAERKDRRGDRRSTEAASPPWRIEVDASVPPGLYDVRAVTELGVSAPRSIHVAPLTIVDRSVSKGKERIELPLESRVAGHVDEGEVEQFSLRAPRDALVVIECLGERIDSRIDATLEVKEAGNGRRVAFSRDRFGLDPAAAFEARAGVEYQVELWDFTYRGRFPYLLSASTQPLPLFAFPPVIEAGAESAVTLYGWNLPNGSRIAGRGDLLESLQVRIPSQPRVDLHGAYRRTKDLLDGVIFLRPAELPAPVAEPLAFLEASCKPVLEKEPNDRPAMAMELGLPCEVCGDFGSPRDLDWFSFRAEKGKAVEIQVNSARLGGVSDIVLLVAKSARKGEAEKVEDLLFIDERKDGFPREDMIQRKFVAPSRDPYAVWTPPEDGTYLLQLRNRNGRSGPEAFFVLGVRPAKPDFTVVVTHSENLCGEAPTLPRGSSQSLDVLIERRGGFTGGVKVEAAGLPAGVAADPVWLAADENCAAFAIRAAADAAPWEGALHVVATAAGPTGPICHEALSSVTIYGGSETRHPLGYVHSRLAESTPLAVRGPTGFAITLEPQELTIYPGSKVSLVARASRADGFTEPIQLSLQGFGEISRAEENGNRPVQATIEKDKSEAKIEVTAKNELPYGPRSLIVFATAQVERTEASGEQGGAQRKRKRRVTLVSNSVTARVVPPFSVEVAATDGVIADGGRLELPFRILREAGVEDELEVSLDLPKDAPGLSAEPVKVAKGQSRGRMVLTSAQGAPGGEIAGVRLRARGRVSGRQFEEKTALPFALFRADAGHPSRHRQDAAADRPTSVRQPFGAKSLEAARVGALRVEVSRSFEMAGRGELRGRATLQHGGTVAFAPLVFAAEEKSAVLSFDLRGEPSLYPARVQLLIEANGPGGPLRTLLDVEGPRA